MYWGGGGGGGVRWMERVTEKINVCRGDAAKQGVSGSPGMGRSKPLCLK